MQVHASVKVGIAKQQGNLCLCKVEIRVFSALTHRPAGPVFYPYRSQSRRPAAEQKKCDAADISVGREDGKGNNNDGGCTR